MHNILFNVKSKDLLLIMLILQLTVYVTALFDVPVARQVFGFIYFTFVPGFIIIQLLKANELNFWEIIIFSAGLSIAFLMLTGLLINEFGHLLGVQRPLTTLPLMTIINAFVILTAALTYSKNKSTITFRIYSLKTLIYAPLLLSLPILSIVGAMYVYVYENNIISLLTLVAISTAFIFCILSKKASPSRLYSYIVLIISIAILFHASLISNHIFPFGSDVAVEFFTFKRTEIDGYWNSTLFRDLRYGRLNAMLSITVLPTIYSNLLNIEGSLFKIIIPLLFSLVPLGLYQVWQTYIGKKYAFAAAFLFMAQQTFYTEMLGLSRQMIAELFIVLLLIVIAHKKMKSVNKTTFFLIFSFALIVSHYALALIFLFFSLFILFVCSILRHPSKAITVTTVAFFCVMMFTWYIYISYSTSFDTLLQFGEYVVRELGNFFDPSSRGAIILRGLGLESPPTIWNALSRAFSYITELLIVIGFTGMITKQVKMSICLEFFLLNLIAMAFLIALIIVPGLANTLNMTRFYHILLFFLSPLCAVGAESIFKFILKSKKRFFALVLLVNTLTPYFLFQTGFVYEITKNDTWAVHLSKYRMDAVRLYCSLRYIDDHSAVGAAWFSKYINAKNVKAYADGDTIFSSLSIYGLAHYDDFTELAETTFIANEGVVFLSTINVIYEKTVLNHRTYNLSDLPISFTELNIIYVNGGSAVYKKS